MTTKHRQGDLLFVKVGRLPKGNRRQRESGILAEGEVTGHHHQLALEDRDVASVLEMDEDRLFVHVSHKAGEGARVIHEEHGTVLLGPGNYEVRIQREYTPKAIVRVRD